MEKYERAAGAKLNKDKSEIMYRQDRESGRRVKGGGKVYCGKCWEYIWGWNVRSRQMPLGPG